MLLPVVNILLSIMNNDNGVNMARWYKITRFNRELNIPERGADPGNLGRAYASETYWGSITLNLIMILTSPGFLS